MITHITKGTTMEYRGSQNDTKPLNVANGSVFIEIESGAKYLYDAENGLWVQWNETGISDEQIQDAVDNYLEEHPVSGEDLVARAGVSQLSESITDIQADLDELDNDKVGFEDYAKSDKGGVIKILSAYGAYVGATGILTSSTKTKEQYSSSENATFICKGTLENVKSDIVRRALTDDTQAEWTDTEKSSACERIGAVRDKGEWEQLNDITLDRDYPTEYILNADQSGKPYNLRKVLVSLYYPADIDGYNYLQANESVRVAVRSSASHRYSIFEATANGVYIMNSARWGTYTDTLGTYTSGLPIATTNMINSLKITQYQSSVIPSGLRIIVYGVRA